MKRTHSNMIRLISQTKNWKRKELNKLIFKYLKKSQKIDTFQKFLIKLLKWKEVKKYSLGRQLNVCKQSGNLKRTFNFISFNRHMIRLFMNTNKIPHLKKLSW